MLNNLTIAIVVKVFEIMLRRYLKTIDNDSKKIEKGDLRAKQEIKLLRRLNESLEKAERIQNALNVLNVERLQ